MFCALKCSIWVHDQLCAVGHCRCYRYVSSSPSLLQCSRPAMFATPINITYHLAVHALPTLLPTSQCVGSMQENVFLANFAISLTFLCWRRSIYGTIFHLWYSNTALNGLWCCDAAMHHLRALYKVSLSYSRLPYIESLVSVSRYALWVAPRLVSSLWAE